jgi:1-deoxy-D-xylulose-5-phosphate synthase
VLFALDRAGVVGADGPTHNGSYDSSFLRCLPNIVLMAPADENECRQMLYTGFQHDGPAAVRYPRGGGANVPVEQTMNALPIGKAERRRAGNKIAILAFGTMVTPCESVAERLNASLVNMRFIKPLDEDLIVEMAESHEILVTVDENVIAGGAGSAVNEVLAARGIPQLTLNVGLPDRLLQHGSRDDMLADAGLTSEAIEAAIRAYAEKTGKDTSAAKSA